MTPLRHPPKEAPGRGMMRNDPARRAQFCKDMYARKVGELAFLEAKLTLTPAQEAAV